MDDDAKREITELLIAWNGGDQQALDELLPLVERELHRLARLYLRGERPGHTFQPSDLVQETYLKLIQQSRVTWKNRAHFLGIAAKLMRRVLAKYAQAHNAAKRGGGAQRLTLSAISLSRQATDVEILALDEVLERLRELDRRLHDVVVLRFYGGLSATESAEVLGVSESTVRRDWRTAKAWLQRELGPEDPDAPKS